MLTHTAFSFQETANYTEGFLKKKPYSFDVPQKVFENLTFLQMFKKQVKNPARLPYAVHLEKQHGTVALLLRQNSTEAQNLESHRAKTQAKQEIFCCLPSLIVKYGLKEDSLSNSHTDLSPEHLLLAFYCYKVFSQ